MRNVASMPPRVNGILETSLYVESPARSAEFYRRVFGFEPLEPGEPLNEETRLCPMRAGDRSVLLLFKKGATPDTDANGTMHIAFGIARSDLPAWERWLRNRASRLSRGRRGNMEARRSTSAIQTVTCWRL